MDLHALLHEWQDGLVADIAITLKFGEAVTIKYFTISGNRDTAKTTIAGDRVWCMTFHKVGVLGFGINSMLYLHDTIVELAVLLFGIIRVATWQNLLTEFKEYGMLALAANGVDHLLIALGCIALKILESEGGGNRCANTCIGKENDVAYNAVEMARAANLGIGGLVETIDTNLNLADKRRKVVNQTLCPKDTI